MNCVLVTGGAGFIGSCYVLCERAKGLRVITLDKLTYSGNVQNLEALQGDPEHIFVQGDIGDSGLIAQLLDTYQPDAIVNFAAESHVDRSILDPDAFVRTNVLGTTTLLRVAKDYWQALPEQKRMLFRFLHISTDEVYGSLSASDAAFTEQTPYAPNSPYSASKAASDHMVRAFYETYGLPVLLTNCSNNYGPRQFPEKLIPLIILNALKGAPLPVYGSGENIRDWLHVEDHCEAIATVLQRGQVGRSYNIGGRSERRNIDVVRTVCRILDELHGQTDGLAAAGQSRLEGATGRGIQEGMHRPYEELITFVKDRPGHDWRYAIDCSRIEKELGFVPRHTFEEGLRETVGWYLENRAWVQQIETGAYREWLETHYASHKAKE